MILKESEIDQDNIIPVLGKPYKEPGKLLTATGSSFYFIKTFTDLEGRDILKWENSKAIFQRYEQGLAVYVNRSNYQRVVLIPSDQINGIQIKKAVEYKNEFNARSGFLCVLDYVLRFIFGTMRIPSNIRSRETKLTFSTQKYRGHFITSYSSFKDQVQYFRKLNLGIKLKVIDQENQ